ncbi:MAG: hypothetical protein WDM86_20195 [Rhizomicrobium sp.]
MADTVKRGAGEPEPDIYQAEVAFIKVVIARLVRATHFFLAAKLDRPHEAGDDGFACWIRLNQTA